MKLANILKILNYINAINQDIDIDLDKRDLYIIVYNYIITYENGIQHRYYILDDGSIKHLISGVDYNKTSNIVNFPEPRKD